MTIRLNEALTSLCQVDFEEDYHASHNPIQPTLFFSKEESLKSITKRLKDVDEYFQKEEKL